MKDFGIKISKPGHDVLFLDENKENPNLAFTSKYDVLKVAQVGSGSFSSGTPKTIAHGLGEPKAFVVWLSTDQTNWNIYDGKSYIDSTNLVISKDNDVTVNYYYPQSGDDLGRKFNGNWVTGDMAVGRWNSVSILYEYGTIRFGGVSETSSIDEAVLGFQISLPSPRLGTVEVKTYGFDEDNTGDFSSDPGGRSRTDTVVTNSCDNGITEIWSFGVTDIFKEITNRSGWSSGNNMGFILTDNSNTDDHYIRSGFYYDGSFLKVTKTAPSQTIYYKYLIFTHKLDGSIQI